MDEETCPLCGASDGCCNCEEDVESWFRVFDPDNDDTDPLLLEGEEADDYSGLDNLSAQANQDEFYGFLAPSPKQKALLSRGVL